MTDMYIPKSTNHPILRIRKNGNKYEMTKKYPVDGQDASKQKEHTIPLTKDEFKTLLKSDGKKLSKTRCNFIHNGKIAEIDIFQDELKGLVLVDFEFETEEEKENFQMPSFCLADVTQEKLIAGGMLCGKSYEDIQEGLKKYNYKKIEE